MGGLKRRVGRGQGSTRGGRLVLRRDDSESSFLVDCDENFIPHEYIACLVCRGTSELREEPMSRADEARSLKFKEDSFRRAYPDSYFTFELPCRAYGDNDAVLRCAF